MPNTLYGPYACMHTTISQLLQSHKVGEVTASASGANLFYLGKRASSSSPLVACHSSSSPGGPSSQLPANRTARADFGVASPPLAAGERSAESEASQR